MASRTFIERWASRSPERRDREFYLVALPGAVTVVGLAPFLFQLVFFPGDAEDLLRLSGRVLAGAVMIGVLCYAITRWLSSPRRWGPRRSRWPLVAHLLLLWTPAAILVDAPLRLAELSMMGENILWDNVTPYILGVSMGRTFLFSGGIVFYERLMDAVLEAADQRQRALWLETQTLKNLIQPHFLLNSLNAVRAYIEDSPEVAEEMLLNLTSLLRQVIQHSSKEKITLDEELNVIKDYVKLMNQRYELNVKLRVDGVRGAPINIPPLILFSLVENSFKHGFSGKAEGHIKIAMETADKLRFIVTDDGTPEERSDKSGGLGGAYVKARLEFMYGGDFTYRHGRMTDGRYEAVIEIPWERV